MQELIEKKIQNSNKNQKKMTITPPGYPGNIQLHINSVSIQLTCSIFLDFFQNKIIDDKSKDGAL